jgi:hypothetical protein
MISDSLAFAVVGHLVGDYLIQNDFLAQGKKVSSPICAVHCALWTLAVLAFSGWWIWWVPIVLFVTHFAQDRGPLVRQYMHLIGQDKFAGPPLGPWSIIAVDNVFHLVVLAVVACFL